jgi:hypothetical protein
MRIKTELKRRLQEFTGIGPTAADIFCVMPARSGGADSLRATDGSGTACRHGGRMSRVSPKVRVPGGRLW